MASWAQSITIGSGVWLTLQKVEEDLLSSWLEFLSSHPRAAQLLPKDSHVITTLEQAMSRTLQEAKRHVFKADKRLERTWQWMEFCWD